MESNRAFGISSRNKMIKDHELLSQRFGNLIDADWVRLFVSDTCLLIEDYSYLSSGDLPILGLVKPKGLSARE